MHLQDGENLLYDSVHKASQLNLKKLQQTKQKLITKCSTVCVPLANNCHLVELYNHISAKSKLDSMAMNLLHTLIKNSTAKVYKAYLKT